MPKVFSRDPRAGQGLAVGDAPDINDRTDCPPKLSEHLGDVTGFCRSRCWGVTPAPEENLPEPGQLSRPKQNRDRERKGRSPLRHSSPCSSLSARPGGSGTAEPPLSWAPSGVSVHDRGTEGGKRPRVPGTWGDPTRCGQAPR